MKQPIRYFSIGLFTASLITLIAFYFIGPKEQTKTESIEEMISIIEADGYHVITQNEYITLSVASDNNGNPEEDDQKKESEDSKEKNPNNKKEKKKKENKDEEEKEEEEEKIETYTLVIEQNMVPSTVSNLLVDNNIIDDADEFNKFMEDKGYSPLIQIGKHEVSSDMSMEELAKELMKFN